MLNNNTEITLLDVQPEEIKALLDAMLKCRYRRPPNRKSSSFKPKLIFLPFSFDGDESRFAGVQVQDPDAAEGVRAQSEVRARDRRHRPHPPG